MRQNIFSEVKRYVTARAGIEPAKSAHDIRRTVAARLYRSTHDVSSWSTAM